MSKFVLLSIALSATTGLIAGPAPEVRPDEMSDVVAVALRVEPEDPKPNEDVRVLFTLRNRATHDEAHVPVTLFAGPNRVATTTLRVAATEVQSVPLSWKPAEAGKFVLSARIDPEGSLVEYDRRDNDASIDVVVAPPLPANAELVISNIEVAHGEETNSDVARVTVANNGNEAATAAVAVLANGKRIGTELVDVPASKSKTFEVSLPANAGAVSAQILGREEAARRSRAASGPRTDPRPALDVSVEQLSVAAMQFEQKRDRRVTISFRIMNKGRQAIHSPFTVVISPGRVQGAPAALAEEKMTINELAAGENVYVSRTIVSPVGEFDVKVEADPEHALAEDNRENNVATWHFKNPTADVNRWVCIGPRLITAGLGAVGRVTAIAIDRSAPGTIYVGAAGSGVWKTLDGGGSWQPIADSLPTLAIAALAITPTNTATVYAATKDSGVFRSDDAGGSWRALPNSPNAEIRWGVLIVSPRDPAKVYMTAADGIYRSTDTGTTWSRVLSNGEATDLVMAGGAPSTLYAGIFRVGVFETVNDGNTWTQLTNGLPASGAQQITLAICRNASRSLYTAFSMTGGLQLFRSDDAGATWTQKNTPPDNTLFNDSIGVAADDPKFVYVSGINLWRSTDGGVTYAQAIGPHVDHHNFFADPVAPETIYALSDGGIFKSIDRGQNWTFPGAGLMNVEFYDHGVAASDPILTFGGTQDNGTLKFSGSADWNEILGGDGATVAIDPTDPNIIYAMNQGADSLQRTSNGSSFSGFAKNLPTGAVCNNLHFQIHPRTRTTLLASCLSLWRTTTTNPPGDWQEILPQPTPGTVVRSAVDPTTDIYYAGTNDGRIFAGQGGANFQTVFTHPSAAAVTDIDVDPADGRVLFVSFTSTGVDRIMRLRRTTSGVGPLTATSIGNGLPANITVQTLAVDRGLNFTAYAGTTRGVYRGRAVSATGAWAWSLYSVGMPPAADVRDLEVHPKTGVLRAATFGRSVFEVNTEPPLGSVLGAEGRITLLRAHDLGTGFGPPDDFLDAEVIVQLDSAPGKSFGFQLRADAFKPSRRGMLDLLRKAFAANRRVRIDFERTGVRSGRIIRTMLTP